MEEGTNVVLFARLRASDRALWCLGRATYVRRQGDRPIAFVWRLQRRLPAELHTSFAAAVAYRVEWPGRAYDGEVTTEETTNQRFARR